MLPGCGNGGDAGVKGLGEVEVVAVEGKGRANWKEREEN